MVCLWESGLDFVLSWFSELLGFSVVVDYISFFVGFELLWFSSLIRYLLSGLLKAALLD